MSTFVDTSALFALLDRDDTNHAAAAGFFATALPAEGLTTHNYVLVETTALVQARLGGAAVRALLDDLVPALEVVWIDEEIHRASTSALLAASRRQVSFVDWTSFEVMRRRGLEDAFAFDRHFRAEGFRTVP